MHQHQNQNQNFLLPYQLRQPLVAGRRSPCPLSRPPAPSSVPLSCIGYDALGSVQRIISMPLSSCLLLLALSKSQRDRFHIVTCLTCEQLLPVNIIITQYSLKTRSLAPSDYFFALPSLSTTGQTLAGKRPRRRRTCNTIIVIISIEYASLWFVIVPGIFYYRYILSRDNEEDYK